MSRMRQAHRVALAIRADPSEPSAVRLDQRRGGPTSVMRAGWTDPDDIRPNATSRPRQIAGYRTYCPLRRMATVRGSQINEAHIHAADILRSAADVAAYGFSAEQTGVRTEAYGPRLGPSKAETRRCASWREFGRAMALFGDGQKRMISDVLLLNNSVPKWCAIERERLGLIRPPDTKIETGKLIAILEVLAEHFAADIENGLRRGHFLAPV